MEPSIACVQAGGVLWTDRGDGDRRVAVNVTQRWVERLRCPPGPSSCVPEP